MLQGSKGVDKDIISHLLCNIIWNQSFCLEQTAVTPHSNYVFPTIYSFKTVFTMEFKIKGCQKSYDTCCSIAANSVLLWCLNSRLAATRDMHNNNVVLTTIILWLGWLYLPQPFCTLDVASSSNQRGSSLTIRVLSLATLILYCPPIGCYVQNFLITEVHHNGTASVYICCLKFICLCMNTKLLFCIMGKKLNVQ